MEIVKSYRHAKCEAHWIEHKLDKFQSKTIGEYRNLQSVRGKHPSWAHSHIRNFARSWNPQLRAGGCQACGYEKHTELAHVTALTEFPDDTPLGIVNSPSNLLRLCPNCHWEFDNLNREEILEKIRGLTLKTS